MKATGMFTGIKVVEQAAGTDDEYMKSRVFFDLTIEGKTHSGLHVDVKQVVGSKLTDAGEIEVGRVQGYPGPFNYADFHKLVFEYYRSKIGPRGGHVSYDETSSVTIENLRSAESAPFTLDIPRNTHGAW